MMNMNVFTFPCNDENNKMIVVMTVGLETMATFSVYCSVMIYRPNNTNKVSKPEHFQFQTELLPVNKTACSFSFALTFCLVAEVQWAVTVPR